MNCCANCFGDRGLQKIFPNLTDEMGDCGYCETNNALVLAPEKLADIFSPLLSIYQLDAAGKTLDELITSDWTMLAHEKLTRSKVKQLLSRISGDANIATNLYSPSPEYDGNDGLQKWEALRTELMTKNRYFPTADFDRKRLKFLLQILASGFTFADLPTNWFRARLQSSDSVFPINEMGAPPARITSHGRANPPGIPYLYLGSTESVAVSEIRPHTGEMASIARYEFSPGITLKLIDLRNPKTFVSPFDFGDEEQIGKIRADLPFLARLGEELTRPVVPQGAAIDYVPSQFLCEFIKTSGYDGVIYRSSVSSGINLALFDPTKAIAKEVWQRRVKSVTVEIG